jgi:hypothetical protein
LRAEGPEIGQLHFHGLLNGTDSHIDGNSQGLLLWAQ